MTHDSLVQGAPKQRCVRWMKHAKFTGIGHATASAHMALTGAMRRAALQRMLARLMGAHEQSSAADSAAPQHS